MQRLSFVVGAVAILLVASSGLAQPPAGGPPGGGGAPGGRGGGAPAPARNLQVLPKDYTTAQVLPIMQQIATGLGVQCSFCHVTQADGAPMNDYAADTKPNKTTARVMLRMAMTINTTLATELKKPADQITQVQCVTCHRGVSMPKQLVDIVTDLGNQKGTDSAIAKYRDLRKQYYGAQAYDFTDATLFTAAQRANTASKPDDAILYANLNLEFNPTSARSWQVMSQAYQRKMDTPQAIAAMEKAVAIDSANMQFQNQLNQLRNPQAGGRGGAPGGGAPGRGGQGPGGGGPPSGAAGAPRQQ